MNKNIRNKKEKDVKINKISVEDKGNRDIDIEKDIGRDTRGGKTVTDTLVLDRDVMGIRDLRQNLANIIDRVTSHYEVITAEDKIRTGRKASIISTDVLQKLLNCYMMNGEVGWDEPTHQYFAKVKEIMVDGVGDTQEDAINMAIDNAEMATENFFNLIEMYMRVSKYENMYPYFLKVKMVKVFDVSLKEVLGFK
ncbi:MAG: hypothetical protein IMZ47_09190 [Firmicutes bacterium]|nr:hypothetical protein [Bacillota bacterium]